LIHSQEGELDGRESQAVDVIATTPFGSVTRGFILGGTILTGILSVEQSAIAAGSPKVNGRPVRNGQQGSACGCNWSVSNNQIGISCGSSLYSPPDIPGGICSFNYSCGFFNMFPSFSFSQC